jgi:hypothetical protein
MSQSLCEIVTCAAIQNSLDSAFANQNNMAAIPLPFLTHVMSEGNRSASTIKSLTGASKVRQVEIEYDQPFLTSDINENTSGCAATATECDFVETYTFDTTLNIGKDLTISPQDLVGTCEENGAFVARKLQKIINGLKEKESERLALAAATQFGAWSQDTADIAGTNVSAGGILEVNTILENGTNAKPVNAALFEQIQTALIMSRINGASIFGANELASYLRKAMAAGSQDGLGFDLMAMIERFGLAAVYDRHLAAALVSVNATNLAVGLGSIVPVGFSLYEADFNKMADSTNIADTIYDPATGMKFDYRMQRVCDDWNINVRATYQYYTAPAYLYQVGSNFEGVKGLAALEVVCTDLAACA